MYYPTRDDGARLFANQAASLHEARLRRDRASQIKTVSFEKEGTITLDREWSYHKFVHDPLDEGQSVQYRRILGFDGFLNSGLEVTIAWDTLSVGYIYESHVISGLNNRVYLEEPFIIESTGDNWEGIRPVITEEPAFPVVGVINCVLIVEVITV